MALRPTQHKTGHFGDVHPTQSLGLVLKKLKPNTTKATTQERNRKTQGGHNKINKKNSFSDLQNQLPIWLTGQ